MRNAGIFLLLVALVAAPQAPVASAIPVVDVDAPDDSEIVVTLAPDASIEAVNSRYGTRTVKEMAGTRIFRLASPTPGQTEERMRRDPAVQRVGRDGRVRRHQGIAFPDDTPAIIEPECVPAPADQYASQLGQGPLAALGIDSADSLVSGSERITVAILDTGIDPNHPAVRDHLWRNPSESPDISPAEPGVDDDGNGYTDDAFGYDFVDADGDPSEIGNQGAIDGHGTFIAGLVALAAPKARIMSLRVLDAEGVGSAFDAAEAVNYAARNGAKVISMSFGTERRVPRVLRDAVRSARSLGIIFVAAAGNSASKKVPYPASEREGVIAVGATDGDERASFSNYGKIVDIAAPGVGLVSAMPGTYPDGETYRYARWSGTSFSTALVAAACSVLLAAQTVASADDVIERLKSHGDNLEEQNKIGDRVNFLEAVGSVFRDAGALDVWAVGRLNMETPDGNVKEVGYTTLRTIGSAERLVLHVCGLEPDARVSLVVANADRTATVAAGAIDSMGAISFVASKNPSSQELALPIATGSIERVALVAEGDGRTLCEAFFGEKAPDVQVWAAVGLARAADLESDAAPFGWAWYGYESAGSQKFEVTVCGLELERTYALRVDGVIVGSQSLAGDEESVHFYYEGSSADELPAPLLPVTRANRVEIVRVDDGGAYTTVAGGNIRSSD